MGGIVFSSSVGNSLVTPPFLWIRSSFSDFALKVVVDIVVVVSVVLIVNKLSFVVSSAVVVVVVGVVVVVVVEGEGEASFSKFS